jgi:hypothetical protein
MNEESKKRQIETEAEKSLRRENIEARALTLRLRCYLVIGGLMETKSRVTANEIYDFAGRVFGILPRAVRRTFRMQQHLKGMTKQEVITALRRKNRTLLATAYVEELMRFYQNSNVPDETLDQVFKRNY